MSRTPLVRPAPPVAVPAPFAYLDEPPEPPRTRLVRRRRRLLTAVVYFLLAGIVLVAGRYVRADAGARVAAPAGSAVTTRSGAPSEGQQPEGRPSEGQSSGGQQSEGRPSEGQSPGGQQPDDRPSEGQPPEVRQSESQPPGDQQSDGRSPGDQQSDGRPSGGQPSEAQPSPSLHAVAGTGGEFAVVPGFGPVLGEAGPVRRFRVAVEKPVGAETASGFADDVNRTLGDGRSWVAARRFRLQRVPISARAEFTVFLASARTSERMCREGGLETAAYTSCRLPRKVIINDDRWTGSVRGYGAPLATYRAYVINHEVGHQFGHGHERCPGKGRRAPVMMQQTYGLKGCVANAWPY